MRFKIIKVQRPLIPPDGLWLAYDERHEHEDYFEPDPWLKEAMGGRMQAYFQGKWSAEGWIFQRRVKATAELVSRFDPSI